MRSARLDPQEILEGGRMAEQGPPDLLLERAEQMRDPREDPSDGDILVLDGQRRLIEWTTVVSDGSTLVCTRILGWTKRRGGRPTYELPLKAFRRRFERAAVERKLYPACTNCGERHRMSARVCERTKLRVAIARTRP